MEVTNVTEYQAIAKAKLPKMAYDYYASGAEDQWTLEENRNAFSRSYRHDYDDFGVQDIDADYGCPNSLSEDGSP
ncbi:hypothetical protein R6Q59_022577 [Mikania micrantha]